MSSDTYCPRSLTKTGKKDCDCSYTRHCCGIPTACGVPALIKIFADTAEPHFNSERVAAQLIGLPHATTAAYCMPQCILNSGVQPCERTTAEATAVRSAILAAGILKAAVTKLATLNDGDRLFFLGARGPLHVLEARCARRRQRVFPSGTVVDSLC